MKDNESLKTAVTMTMTVFLRSSISGCTVLYCGQILVINEGTSYNHHDDDGGCALCPHQSERSLERISRNLIMIVLFLFRVSCSDRRRGQF
jgi:hypothetical protein